MKVELYNLGGIVLQNIMNCKTNYKVIAVGNTLMKDDAVAIRIVESIKKELEESYMEVIIGETDFQYCISMIKEGDFIIIIDAAFSEKEPGEISVMSIEECHYPGNMYTQHAWSLIALIKLYFKRINGCIIGIEAGEVDYGLDLSDELSKKIEVISQRVLGLLKTAERC